MGRSCITAIFGDPLFADLFHDTAESFDLGDEGVDVGFGDDEVLFVVAGFQIGAAQQVEQAFFFVRVAGEYLCQFQRIGLALLDQKL